MRSEFFPDILVFFSKKLGLWFFSVTAWFIASGYFLFFPWRVSVSARFYRQLFPDKGWFHAISSTWKQYHNYTRIYIDRLLIRDPGAISFDSIGLEHLQEAKKQKTGGIILMSHMGNWEIASQLLKREGFRLLLYVGIKYQQQMERLKKKHLELGGIKTIAVDKNGGSPFDILDGVNFLKSGGFISLTGDRIWDQRQRAVPVMFMGRKTLLPESPHLIALLSGAPLFTFFSTYLGKNRYRFSISPPVYVKSSTRKERKTVIERSAQHYADLLEAHLRRHPLEWYHFESFFHDTQNR
jgi:predicted LPLAT superfamily acyltransferase